MFGEATYVSFINYVNTEIVHDEREVLNSKATTPHTSAGNPVKSLEPKLPPKDDGDTIE